MDLKLGGLSWGLTLSDLTSTLLFSQPTFGEPTSGNTVDFGPIVPDPSDFFDSVLTDSSGAVESIDGQFVASLPANNISSDGTFFSFRSEAIAAGSGSITFDPFSLIASDDLGNVHLNENDPFLIPIT